MKYLLLQQRILISFANYFAKLYPALFARMKILSYIIIQERPSFCESNAGREEVISDSLKGELKESKNQEETKEKNSRLK